MRTAPLYAHKHATHRVAAQKVDAADLYRHEGSSRLVRRGAGLAEHREERMKTAVHQCGMQQPWARRLRVAERLRHLKIAERNVALHPHLMHPAEGRTVVQTDGRRVCIERIAAHRGTPL